MLNWEQPVITGELLPHNMAYFACRASIFYAGIYKSLHLVQVC